MAGRIVAAVRAQVSPEERDTWTRAEVVIDDADADAFASNPGAVLGCFPIGWHVLGKRGHTGLSVGRML